MKEKAGAAVAESPKPEAPRKPENKPDLYARPPGEWPGMIWTGMGFVPAGKSETETASKKGQT